MIKVKEIKVNNFITESKLPDADFVINPYIGCPHKCIYCYAEFMKRFTNHNEDWGDFLDVKISEKPLNKNKISGKTVLFGSVTDPYNSFEKKYRITRNILEQLVGCDSNVEILTKSDLVLRDLDLLSKIENIRVGISMNTLDDTFRKSIEPHASSIDKRINALKELRNHRINTYLFMSPMFPAITAFKEIIIRTAGYVDMYCFENLNLRGGYLPRVLNYIEQFHPNLIELYHEIYKNKNMDYWLNLENQIRLYCNEKNLNYKIYFYHEKIKKA